MDISNDIFNQLKNYICNKNGFEISLNQFHYIGNDDMSDSVKSLTDFFIFLKRKNNSCIIYIEGNYKNIEITLENNMCIISDYQIMFINL